jgi:transaldolase
MSRDYFNRLYDVAPTRMWINNPSGEDCDRAIEAGAINCTTNPQYSQKLMFSDPEYLQTVIDNVILKETTDHECAARRVYQIVSKRVMNSFRPLYEKSNGSCASVTMQDDPRQDEETPGDHGGCAR